MKKNITDIDWADKRAILRCDFNVPLDGEKITDDTRIREALPTIKYLLDKGASIVLLSHLGRPKGKADKKFSLQPVADELKKIINADFFKSDFVVDENIKAKVHAMKAGQVAILENVRFRQEEELNDPAFAKELAGLGDIFVNDAFGTAHRAHASTSGIASYIPAVSGFLIEEEMSYLDNAVHNPKRPLLAIMGGAKINDKIPVIKALLDRVDRIIIGGGMAYTFFKAKGYEIGSSLLDENSLDFVKSIIDSPKILIPVDVKVADRFANDAKTKTVSADQIPSDMMGLDIGPKSIELFTDAIKKAQTIVWNGPMGVFEMPEFEIGTKAIAEALANSKALTIIGGGDSAAAIKHFGLSDKMSHISTGGGASLKVLEGQSLPGVEIFEEK